MRVIDSHTCGQPTRVIVTGGPDLGAGPLSERRELLAREHDELRRKSILEPKCSEAMVGALLCDSPNPECAAGVIFFNNTGYLGMCGHGTIGLAVTLAYLGKLGPGTHLIDTPSGVVRVGLDGPNNVSVENVPSYCFRQNVELQVEGLGTVSGSIAWGGNWFFLVDQSPCELSRANIPQLTDAAIRIKRALVEQAIFGADGAEIDHIEFFGLGQSPDADSQNFVLCPGLAYDRSPCGTGTSAKIACLAERGQLAPGQEWVQESIMGSRFRGSYRLDDAGRVIPTIAGTAYVFADASLVDQAGDPFAQGFG
ncbi:proline racemase family protein [uncultured Erythrobacter sp.]|uniref:proline racemase family protein n=1 Tax=uncultured Erythrobacter sp. TaxID=263913 RepID=UPI00260F254F|nr:proline racemase family protein [uncultured Erythrobacter sp.]